MAAIFGGLLGYAIWRSHSELRRIASASISPIAQTQAGRVALRGVVVQSDRGTATALDGRPAVIWAAFIFDECAATETTDMPERRLRETRAFWLDDGSGARAWIEPHGCVTRIQATQHGEFAGIRGARGDLLPNRVIPLAPAVHQWSLQHYRPFGPSRITVDETVVAPGDTVFVIGRAKRSAEGVLSVAQSSEPNEQLLISTLSPAALQGSVKRNLLAYVLTLLTLLALAPIVVAIAWWLG